MTIYVVLTENCNLSCSHCRYSVKTKDFFNKDKVISVLEELKDANIIIFGGEPTLYTDRLLSVLPYANSISTNLMCNSATLDIIKDLPIATSYNPSRFTKKQYFRWVKNLAKLSNKPTLLITLTKDLLDIAPKELFDTLPLHLIGNITFEYEIANNYTEYYTQVDEYLSQVYDLNPSIPINNFEQLAKGYIHDCSQTYTLYPNGEIKYGCPNYYYSQPLDECYSCKMSSVCKPCALQQHCSFPIRTYEKINNEHKRQNK